ncbi:PAS domain-containing sensor histidine kinase [Bacillus sp. M6-12]|uniref:PAS domain S-box protein n=1 Tax=Bacillus sp. M6-12 TaxID=2054166 RepID=UPI000C787C23|nr:PAS domain S-box protein [Bacillus sp. M6-12]PLS17158.1 PAS domain-containing sensor histidine kinase [Bacillus sp. M6-12]
METVIFSSNPILIVIAIILTYIAAYTALDLITLIQTKEKNRRFLFLGSSFSLGIGIWAMNFFGSIVQDLISVNVSLMFLSMILGISFSGMAVYSITNRRLKNFHMFEGSILLTLAVLANHIVGITALKTGIHYDMPVLTLTVLIMLGMFYFSLWLLSGSNRFVKGNQFWLKPVGALIITGAIIEGNFLLSRAMTYQEAAEITQGQSSLLIYIVVFVSILILGGLVSSSTLLSRRLAASDIHVKDLLFALDESSIVAITDPKGRITYVNDKFIEISKYTEAELIGQDHAILNSGYHSKEFFKELWRTIGQGKTWYGEIRNKAKDGSLYWVNTTIVPFLNRKGKPYQYVSIRTDITNRKKAEIDLKNSLKDIKDIHFALDQSSIVAFTDNRGVITNVNDRFCETSKYSREELIGSTHRILNSGYHSKDFFKNLWDTISSGSVWKGEIRNRAKDGSFYWVSTTIVPFLDERNKPYQYLAIRNDITERKKTEEIVHRQDKLAAVGQLAAGVAHEIRNPLTSMKGYAEFLQLDETSPERREYLDIILDEIDRVNSIVEEFMVLAKPQTVDLEERNIIPIIQNVLSLVEFEAKKKKVTLDFQCDESFIKVSCDENRLKQVFLNFLKNGIEAMPNGGNMTVTAETKDKSVHVAFKDTGVGIPEEKLKKLGEPFFTTKKNGNGLGLMVSFRIIESHRGKVFIESRLNEGTTFSILLPAESA